MKSRPEKWSDLPYYIRLAIADNAPLEYDRYESSQAEALDSLMCGNGYDNDDIVQEYYKRLSDNEFMSYIRRNKESLESQLEEIKEYLE